MLKGNHIWVGTWNYSFQTAAMINQINAAIIPMPPFIRGEGQINLLLAFKSFEILKSMPGN